MAFQNSASRMYSDIHPRCEWIHGEEFNTLMVHVPGFKKEELKAQVDTSRNLKVSGEHNIEGNKWCRFHKSFQLPNTCEISKIKAKIDNGVLYVMVPKSSALEQTPSQVGNTATTAMPTAEQSFQDNSSGYLQEGQDTPQQFSSCDKPVKGIAKSLSKQKLVILNVVIAATLLALVLFRRYKLTDGDNNLGHDRSSMAQK